MLNIPGGGALRRIRGNPTSDVLAESRPNTSQSSKNETQIVSRLRMNPTIFGKTLFSFSRIGSVHSTNFV